MKRVKYSQNGLLARHLSERAPKAAIQDYRQDFSSIAIANKKEEKEGIAAIAVRPFTARKCTPSGAIREHLDNDYNVLHGFAPGSLTHFLISLHALGFRVFAKGPATMQFMTSALFEKAYAVHHQKLGQWSERLPGSSPATHFEMMSTGVRGKGPNTDEDVLFVRLMSGLTGKTTSDDEQVVSLVKQLSQAICSEYDTWSAMTANALDACGIIDAALTSLVGRTFDSTPVLQQYRDILDSRDKDIKSSTFVFDASAPDVYTGEFRHDLIAVMDRYAREVVSANPKEKINKVVKTVQGAVTTDNANGLSFLFNKGIPLLRTTPINTLMEYLDVKEAHKARLETLVTLAKAIDYKGSLGPYAVKNARASVKSFIDSTIANYFGRLASGRQALMGVNLQDAVILPDLTSDQLTTVGTTVDEICQFSDAMGRAMSSAAEMAGVLLGEDSDMALDDVLTAYQQSRQMLIRTAAWFNTLNNKLHRAGLPKVECQDIAVPSSLPFFNPQIADIGEHRAELVKRRDALVEEYQEVLDTLYRTYACTFAQALDNEADKQKALIANRVKSNMSVSSPEIAARRLFLSRLLSCIYRSDAATRQSAFRVLTETAMFDARQLREHIFERKHYVYVSPMDTRPKKIITIDNEKLLSLDIEMLCGQLLEGAQPWQRDYLVLYKTINNILMNGLPDTVDTELVDCPNVREHGAYMLLSALDEPQLSRSDTIQLINTAYNSQIAGMNYQLNRQQFMDSKTFKCFESTAIYYVPKPVTWTLPAHVYSHFEAVLTSAGVEVDESRSVDVTTTARLVAKYAQEHADNSALALLKQLPHRWYVQAGIAGLGTDHEVAIDINEGKVHSSGKKTGLIHIRTGDNNLQSRNALYSLFEGGKSSPMQMKLERHYHIKDDVVVEDKSKCQLVFNVPFTQRVGSAHRVWNPAGILGIDHGEYGFGVALVDIHDQRVVDSGFVAVRAIQKYCERTRQHRTVTTPRQQYKRNYSNHLEQTRDSAVGAICSYIDNLMLQTNAIPVFEYIANPSGPVEDIWQAVHLRYQWGDNDAQNALRVNHWKGGNRWLANINREDGEPVKVFPGGVVGGADSSYHCPCCQRSAVNDVKTLISDNPDTIVINGAVLTTLNGELALCSPDSETVLARKQKGFQPAWKETNSRVFKKPTLTNASGKELLNLVRRSVRRPNPSRHAQESLGAQFHCPYTDCKETGSSDAFAATNHARKWLNKKLDGDV